MRTPLVLTLAALTMVHAVAPTPTGATQEERASVSAVGAILALDAAIQKRFEKVDGRFGYTRLLLRNGAHGFAPENDEEISSLRELQDANLRVALYLASRSLVATRDENRVGASHRIKGPLLITRGPFDATPPAASMRAEARRAFALFERTEQQHDFELGGWMVVARPVRALNDTCLKCHRSTGGNWPSGEPSDLRVGDALGVVFYAYQESGIRNQPWGSPEASVYGTSILIVPSCRDVTNSSPSRLCPMWRSVRMSVVPIVFSTSSLKVTSVRLPPASRR